LPVTSPPSAAPTSDAWLHALRHVPVEEVLLPVLLQLALIICSARVFAALLRRLRQPGVVGELAAGLVLGPSLFGRLWPEAFAAVFHPPVAGLPARLGDALLGWILTTLSQLGLVFLLFLIGLEFDFGHLRWHGQSAFAISVAGMVLPFGLGFGVALLMQPSVAGDHPPLGFALFLATAMSITAIPMLGRIMMELNITRTRLGAVTIAAAAVDDAAGWILLAAVAAIVQAEFSPARTGLIVLETVAFALGMLFVARPLLRRWARHVLRRGDGEIGLNTLAVLLTIILACALVTNRIGIFAVFGPFLLGAVLSGEHELRRAVSRRLGDFVSAFFVPIFFAYTGLRTDVSSLGTWGLWLWCGLVGMVAIAGKFGGCALAAGLTGAPAREAGCVGALMNTRGLMALVVINLGKDLGVVPDSVFCMLVLMALFTTVLTTPLVLALMRGTELEPYVMRSGFLGGRQAEGASPRESLPVT
jgi:Kef-type K+ transport system membrane component KefB